MHRAHLALHALVAAVAARHDPVLAHLQVDHVTLFEVVDLVGHAGQRHRVGGEKTLAVADPQHQRRALARADHALRLVAAEHRQRVGPLQPPRGLLDGVEQVALVQRIDQVRDDLGVGLAREHVAARLQLGAQLVVVLDDAVVDQRDACRAVGLAPRPGREVRMRVVHRRRAVGGPAGVGDAGRALHAVGGDLRVELGHARGAARAAQRAGLVDGDAAGVVAAVFEPLQAFDEDGNDVARADRADDAAHGCFLGLELGCADLRQELVERAFIESVSKTISFSFKSSRLLVS